MNPGKERIAVFESDDWGACERSIDLEHALRTQALWQRLAPKRPVNRWHWGTLEAAADLERLCSLLGQHRGSDGRPAIFTAFFCAANPDYERIAASGFAEFAEIGIDAGVPAAWERGDLPAAWQRAAAGGVFAPAFHSNLHHMNPSRWLEVLRGTGLESELARALFAEHSYSFGQHLPEYEGLNLAQQKAMVELAVCRIERATGVRPAAAICSDAYPETEGVWAQCGLHTVCMKNTRLNNGEVVVYGTKPWNHQDPNVAMGTVNHELGVTYLCRNVTFEVESADEAYATARTRWEYGEPAVVSTHRAGYVSVRPELAAARLAELDRLLRMLTAAGARFMSSAELGLLYENGIFQKEAAE